MAPEVLRRRTPDTVASTLKTQKSVTKVKQFVLLDSRRLGLKSIET